MYLCIREKYFLGMECKLNMKFIHVSYILHTHSLNEIIYNNFDDFMHETFMLSDFCTCTITSMLKIFQILANFGFWMLD
jgi:hypothetical protein